MSLVAIGEYLVNPAHVMYVHISRSIITNETHHYLTMINGKSLCITGLSLSEIHDLLDPILKYNTESNRYVEVPR